LTVDYTAGGSADDRLAIRNQGTGVGEIGVSGSNVTYGGTTIGSFSGGSGTDALVVSFNANATPAATQALARNITYANVSDDPSTEPHPVRVAGAASDGAANGGSATRSDTGTIRVVAVNYPPVVDLNGGGGGTGYTNTFTEDGGAVAAAYAAAATI